MELENRFEVPVGIDRAWATLLDLEKVGPCFPGASLDSVDGDEFTGQVKVKLGPIQLTYAGKATIVEKDEAAHRARIDASGSAPRSGSTASMQVTATATALGPERTAVDLVTTLAITGRPAQFGRGVMVEVGNKLIGQFADCVSAQLAGEQESAPTPAAAAAPAEVTPLRTGPRPAPPTPEPIDLLGSAGAPVLKRLLPALAGVAALLVLVRLLRRHRGSRGGSN